MPIVKYFDLYLNEGVSVAPVIHANQYDKTEQWIFTLYEESGTKYTPSTGAIIGIKSDGKGILNTATVNSNGQVVVNETKQMTAAAGTAIFELLIDSSEHGTANFKVEVEPRPADNADMSDSDYSLLQNAVDSAEEILDIIGDTDLEEVVAEDINAWMDAHPEATTTVQDDSLTTPKFKDGSVTKAKLASDAFDGLISETASGNPASFNDGADGVPVKLLKVSINPVQSGEGDPSPTNIRPITGHTSATVTRTGKNLFNKASITNGYYLDVNTGEPVLSPNYYISDFIPVVKNKTVFIPVTNTTRRWFYDTKKNPKLFLNNSNNQTFTPTENGYIRLSINNNISADGFQVEYGTIATAYEPYQGQTVTIDLNGTRYGGTLDVLTGVLTVTHGYASLNDTMKWQELTSSTANYRYNNEYSDRKKYNDSYAGVICSCLPIASGQPTYGRWLSATSNYFGIRNTTGTLTLDEVKALATANQIQICYELAEQITVQLTPQQVTSLLGVNHISADCGDLEVVYRADTKLYIDSLTEPDSDMVADMNIESGKYFIVNNHLYLSTTAIAQGDSIVVGMNCTETNLADALNALNA